MMKILRLIFLQVSYIFWVSFHKVTHQFSFYFFKEILPETSKDTTELELNSDLSMKGLQIMVLKHTMKTAIL